MAMLKYVLLSGVLLLSTTTGAAQSWRHLYEPVDSAGLPCRVMKPINFDASQKYPVIVSLHGAGGKGSDNQKQLKVWNGQLAEKQLRTKYPCYVLAPQAAGLWDAENLSQIKKIIGRLSAVDMKRIYILGHSMGGHGTYIFIQLDPDYFAAAAPSAGSGRKQTAEFISPSKIKRIPIWAFHGDRDGVCPIAKDQHVFAEMKRLGGNMKFTTWAGANHAVSDRFIPGNDTGSTQLSGKRCDKEPDFMTWLFKQRLP